MITIHFFGSQLDLEFDDTKEAEKCFRILQDCIASQVPFIRDRYVINTENINYIELL